MKVFIVKGKAFGCFLAKFNAFKRMRETYVFICHVVCFLGALKWLTSLFFLVNTNMLN